MKSYLLRRLWQSLLVLFGVSVVVFLILHLTGDPAALLLPPDATADDIAKFRTAMGFDDPVAVQYLRFLKGAVRGDFGESLRHGEPAMGLVVERLPATFSHTFSDHLEATGEALIRLRRGRPGGGSRPGEERSAAGGAPVPLSSPPGPSPGATHTAP